MNADNFHEFDPEASIPPYEGLLQDLSPAFQNDTAYTLTHVEVGVVYLALSRLQELERMAKRRDWDGIMLFTPDDEEGNNHA